MCTRVQAALTTGERSVIPSSVSYLHLPAVHRDQPPFQNLVHQPFFVVQTSESF